MIDALARGLAAAAFAKVANFFRPSTNVTEVRNGTNSQTFYVYDTYTDASNYRRLKFSFSGGDCTITTEAAGTGTAGLGDLILLGASGKQARLGGNAAIGWTFTSSNNLIAQTDLTASIGGQAANRPLAVSAGSYSSLTTSQSGTTYSATTSDSSIIFTNAATVTLTLPAAASFTGRKLHLKTTGGGAVNSATSNVVPLAGGAASTAILATTAGKWAELQSDGTNWVVMAAN